MPALGITGTGGSGKSSLTDELIRRFRLDQDDRLEHRRDRGRSVAAQVAAARCSGDRIRMNAIDGQPRVFMRSLATRDAGTRNLGGAARRDRRVQASPAST